jgi:hypothetical protein
MEIPTKRLPTNKYGLRFKRKRGSGGCTIEKYTSFPSTPPAPPPYIRGPRKK